MLNGVEAVICVVSSFGVDWFLEKVFPKIDLSIPVLLVTKGMINNKDGSLITYPEYLIQKLEEKGIRKEINVVGNPCISYELADIHHSLVCYCGNNAEELKIFKEIFEMDYYHISLSTDIRAVELSVDLKNAYDLAVYLAVEIAEVEEGKEGINHYNPQAALFTEVSREMGELLTFYNWDKNQLELGIGDLYVTIYGGRTRRIGTLLGRGISFDESMEILKGVTLESIVISKRMRESITKLSDDGKIKIDNFPLLMHVYELIANSKKVNIPWDKFNKQDFEN